MKKYIYMFLLCVSCTAALGQDAPPLDAKAISPNPTWYKKIAGTDTSYYMYSGGQWAKFARSEWVKKLLQDGLASAAKLDGTNFFSGYNNFQNLGARTMALSSYSETLVPGDVSAGNYKVSSSNNGPFIGNTSYRNQVPKFRWGERAGGGAFVVQKFVGGTWVDVLSTSGNSDSAFVKRPELDSAVNAAKITVGSGLTKDGNVIKLGGAVTENSYFNLPNLNGLFFSGWNTPTLTDATSIFSADLGAYRTNFTNKRLNNSTQTEFSSSGDGMRFGMRDLNSYNQNAIIFNGSTDNSVVLFDGTLSKTWFKYATDLSANGLLDDRSIPDLGGIKQMLGAFIKKDGSNTFIGTQNFQGQVHFTNTNNKRGINTSFDYTAGGSVGWNFFIDNNNIELRYQPSVGDNDRFVVYGNNINSPVQEGESLAYLSDFNNYVSKTGGNTVTGNNSFINGRVDVEDFRFGNNIHSITSYNSYNQPNITGFKFQVGGNILQLRYQPDTFGANRLAVTNSDGSDLTTIATTLDLNNYASKSGGNTLNGNQTYTGGAIYSTDGGVTGTTISKELVYNNLFGFVYSGPTRQAELGGNAIAIIEKNIGYGTSLRPDRITFTTGSNSPNELSLNTLPITGSNKLQTFQNKSGTIALLSDITTFVGDTTQYLRKTGGTFTGSVYLAHDAVAEMEPVTKNQLYNVFNGLSWKNSVRAKAPGNVTLSGVQTIDGVSGVANGRYLLTNQTNSKENGIWLMQAGAWVRSSDADSGEELTGLTVSISLGSTGTRYSQWTYIGDANPIIGVDNISFGQISGPGTYGAGTGLIANANLFSLDQTFVKSLFSAIGPLSFSNGAFSIAQSGINQDGYLSSSDFNTFANKQPAGNYITALTGEVMAAGPGSAAATINKAIAPTWTGQHTFNTQTNFGGSLIPTTNATYSLGNSGGNFLNVYSNSLQSNTSITLNTTNGNGIVFNIGGLEKLRISPANGNLLIGTTTDDGSSKLQVNGQAVIVGRTALNSTQGSLIPAAVYIGTAPINTSGSFNLSGFGINQQNNTYTSSATGSTIAQATVNGYGQATVVHSNPTTITKMYGNYFRWSAAGANTTITNNYAAGFAGDVEVTGQAFISSNTVIGNGVPNSKFTVYQSVDGVSGGASIFSTAGTNIRLWADATNARISGSGSENSNVVINGTGTGQVLVGSTTTDGISRLQVNGQASINGALIPASNNTYLLGNANQNWLSVYTNEINRTGANTYLNFRLNGTDQGRWFTNTGNLVIGGTTDAGTGKFQVVGSISATTDISVLASDRGLILKSPDGTRYRVTIANGGTLQTTAL